MLANQCLPILQNLLFVRIEDSKPIRISSTGLFGELVFNILNSSLVCDFDTRRQLPNRLVRR